MTEPNDLPACLTRLDELTEARRSSSAGARLSALRAAAPRLRDRIASSGTAVCVRTYPIATFPYPAEFGFSGAALSPAPYAMIRNRMQLVQIDAEGELINILVNPTDPQRSSAAPFFARQIERFGEFVARRVMSEISGTPQAALDKLGIAPADIHFITFDHMHVQDVRGLLGTADTAPLLPRARLLVQREELELFDSLHPMQDYWYVRDGVRGVARDRIVALDGDYLIGSGFAIVKTPGHTAGNHTLVVNTDRGLWTISENGIAVECYAPEASSIPGLRRHARTTGAEVILNGNTREGTLDQYTSMIVEKTIADRCAERPEFPQHFPSSEIVASALAPGLRPAFTHRSITHGEIRAQRRSSASDAA